MLFSFRCSYAQFIKSIPVARICCFFFAKACLNSRVMGVSMPTRGIYFLAMRIFSITRSEQLEAPRLKRSSSSPASPSFLRLSYVAAMPLVYRCWCMPAFAKARTMS